MQWKEQLIIFHVTYKCLCVTLNSFSDMHAVSGTVYSSEKEFKQKVDSYMTFYNQQRPHRTLRNKTPNQVEIEFASQQPDM